MIECWETMGVVIALTRLVDSMRVLLDRRRKNSTHQFLCSSEDEANPQIGLQNYIDGLDLIEPLEGRGITTPVMRTREAMDRIRLFMINSILSYVEITLSLGLGDVRTRHMEPIS